jgi:K(+)-stimulated pyrophosphate-energized sodium pump
MSNISGLTALNISTFDIYICSLIGLAVTAAMVLITEYYTSTDYSPVKDIAESSTT